MEAILFDLDGTLIDSMSLQRESLRIAFRRTGGQGEPPYREFFALSGGALPDIMGRLGLPGEAVEIYRQVSLEHSNRARPFPGIIEFLGELSSRGIKLGLCTGKDGYRVQQLLLQCGLDRLWGAVVVGDEVTHPKPDPEPLLLALHRLGVLDASKAIYVGDSPNDMLAAQVAGLQGVAVSWGVGLPHELQGCGGCKLAGNLEELRRVVESVWIQ